MAQGRIGKDRRLLNPQTWFDWSWLRPLLELSLAIAVATYERSPAQLVVDEANAISIVQQHAIARCGI
jgi:hypothetical protein